MRSNSFFLPDLTHFRGDKKSAKKYGMGLPRPPNYPKQWPSYPQQRVHGLLFGVHWWVQVQVEPQPVVMHLREGKDLQRSCNPLH